MKRGLRQSPRLREFDYAGAHAYSLTFVTRQRAPVSRNANAVCLAEDSLLSSTAKHHFSLVAYCFMPDHVHALVIGGDDSRLADFVRLFKQLAGYHVKQLLGAPLWQTSFYDHVVRTEEDLSALTDYVLDNPVRAGLVSDRADYPHSGPRLLVDAH